MLPREAITIDHLSEGRLELGLGAGHMKWELDAAELPWRRLAERVDGLTHTVSELRRLFTDGFGEPESAVKVRERFGRQEQRPVQRHGFGGTGPPLLIGGTGDRVLRLAAQHADIRGRRRPLPGQGRPPGTFHLGTAAAADERIVFIRETAGERADQLELNVLVQFVSVTGDRRGAAESLASDRLPYLTVEETLETPYLLIGTADEIAEQLRENRERFGFSYITVHEPYMRELGPIVEKLRG